MDAVAWLQGSSHLIAGLLFGALFIFCVTRGVRVLRQNKDCGLEWLWFAVAIISFYIALEKAGGAIIYLLNNQ